MLGLCITIALNYLNAALNPKDLLVLRVNCMNYDYLDTTYETKICLPNEFYQFRDIFLVKLKFLLGKGL